MAGGYIYILGSDTGTLCIGVTSNLYHRVQQHKDGTLRGFTADYGCKRLLYFEPYQDIRTAIAREKQLKGWLRGVEGPRGCLPSQCSFSLFNTEGVSKDAFQYNQPHPWS